MYGGVVGLDSRRHALHPLCVACCRDNFTMLSWVVVGVVLSLGLSCAADNDFVAGNDDSANGFFIAYVSDHVSHRLILLPLANPSAPRPMVQLTLCSVIFSP